MKTGKIFVILSLAIFLLAGCGPKPSLPDDQPESSSYETAPSDSSDPLDPAHSPLAPDGDIPPGEGLVRSIFTNEWIDAKIAADRPIAVMIPNEANAIPHYSISDAQILYEARVEGSMTRMMAVYENWRNIRKIGNVRSLRSYFAYWAFEWDAFIVHYGGPFFIYDLLGEEDTQNVDGQFDGGSFYRTADREAPHNAYTSGKLLMDGIQKKDYDLSYRGLADETHFRFSPKGSVNDLSQYGSDAVNASFIDMTEPYPLTRCYFTYDEASGLYYRYQYLSGGSDGPHIDAANGEQLSFSNILVQRVKQEDIGNGYLSMQCQDTTLDGWFFTRGKGIHVTWEKTSDYGATRFYDDNQLQIELNTGKTMILIIRDTDSFIYR